MKLDRLLSIVVLLLSRSQVTAKQLAERFGVSQRTIYRDMLSLESAGFPIVAIHGNEGGYQLMSGFKLDAYTFSEAEKAWLMGAMTLQNELVFDTAIGAEIMAKLRLLLAAEPLPLAISLGQGTLHRQTIETQTKKKVAQLQEAIRRKVKLKVSYVSARGQVTERIVNPRQLQLKNGSWYLIADCELRQGERAFKLTRMRGIVELAVEVTTPSGDKPVVATAYHVVTCRFGADQLGKLYDFFTEAEITTGPHGALEVCFQIATGNNLVPFLLMFGDKVQVVSPESVRKAHQKAIAALQKIYLD